MKKIIRQPIPKLELNGFAQETFGTMVKGVVDCEREIIALGGELHADEETLLLQDGSKQENLWGINIYPNKPLIDAVEFDSMINIRPSDGNYSRNVESQEIREKIIALIHKLIPDL